MSLFSSDAGRLEKSLTYLHWSYVAGAVMDVFRQNQGREAIGGEKASADTWGLEDHLRLEVWARVRQFWSNRSGLPADKFPFTVDQTVRVYMRYRKRNEDELRAFELEIAEGTPPSQGRTEA